MGESVAREVAGGAHPAAGVVVSEAGWVPNRHRIAVVGCRNDPSAADEDLYPDADLPLLPSALEALDADVTAVAWDDDTMDWAGVDAAVVRSTWDSVDRPREFLDWARRATAHTLLLNPVAALAWNLDKAYLRELHDLGVPIVPTTWVTDDSRWTPPAHEFVVKPSVSAGGRETARYQPDEADSARRHVRRLLAAGHTVMVQPYVASVDEMGEAKLVHVDGALSHAVRVGALLEPGAGVVERPWEREVPVESITPTPAERGVAEAVVAGAYAVLGAPLLYARVDLVTAPNGAHWLAELELVDPMLFLGRSGQAAHRLAAAIVARCSESRGRH